MGSEANNLKDIQLKTSAIKGVRLFRNNVGAAKMANGDFLYYGVCNPGGSDLIGWTQVEVTQEMVGKKVAVFTAIEVKSDTGTAKDAQKNFIRVVKESGGFGMDEARDAKTVLELLTGPIGV